MPDNIIGRTRQRRSLHNIFLTFDAETVPDKPNEAALNQLKLNFIDHTSLKKIKDLFEEQPIWLKIALSHAAKVSAKHIKFVLPVVAYYFSSGPWRNQWIKYGYDPRKDSKSSPFQTLDYRMRYGAGARMLIKAKKRPSNVQNPYKTASSSKARTSMIDFTPGVKKSGTDDDAAGQADDTADEKEEKLKDAYLFRMGRLPPYRQMFYQYKDIQITEAQILMTKYKSNSNECNEKNGWFKSGLDSKLRDILADSIKKFAMDDDAMSMASSVNTSVFGANSSIADADDDYDVNSDLDIDEEDP
jgi:general transcription factor 3C polypeptide 5 (transcription factor C subunit 1)